MIFRLFILISFVTCGSFLFGQDTTRIINFDEIKIIDKRIIKRQGLYDSYEVDKTKNINGYTQLTIFDNTMSDEVWYTENVNCVSVDLKANEKDTYLQLQWNKDRDGCDWVGVGFGWDFWTSKDISGILDIAAIEFEVRSTGKDITNLPWAMGFEDYSNGQAWTGFLRKYFVDDIITTEWSKVQIPLSIFPFVETDTDPSNIKQMIVQLFAEGVAEINRIELVPFTGKLRESVISESLRDKSISVDGNSIDWNANFTSFGDGHSFATKNSSDSLYIAVKVKDQRPFLNNKTNADLWNGDAIEIAIATNPKANLKRGLFLLSDYHFGLNCGLKPYLWNFSDDKLYSEGNFGITKTDYGYFAEIAIPLKKLMNADLKADTPLGFEIAVDEGNEKMIREIQTTWNGHGATGFHSNPSLWGTIVLK